MVTIDTLETSLPVVPSFSNCLLIISAQQRNDRSNVGNTAALFCCLITHNETNWDRLEVGLRNDFAFLCGGRYQN
jgi:hypothetical protein